MDLDLQITRKHPVVGGYGLRDSVCLIFMQASHPHS